MRHLIDPLDFSVEEIDALLDLAGEIERNREKYSHCLLYTSGEETDPCSQKGMDCGIQYA